MIKRISLLTALSALCTLTINAQEIKKIDATMQDYVELLKAKGYEAWPFDISCLKDSTYTLAFEVKEYTGGQESEISSKQYRGRKNRTMVSDFMWRELSTEELEDIKRNSYDYEKGVYSLAEKIMIGFTPNDVDSVAYARISIENMGSMAVDLKLKPIDNPLYEKPLYKYLSRPFKPGKFEEGKFIPLVLYCSFWYDAKHNIVRCCGAKEIDPSMTSEILKDSPHYYVIGVSFSTANRRIKE
ncbi:MAG: DUF5041 domain-containing protein [Candidatus Cryptobacteroides sp.]